MRSAVVSGATQGSAFVLRTASMIVMARLLFPADFGLVGMVTAVTGFMAFFHDFGLSVASVQRTSVTHEQISTLFWVNLAVGTLLSLVCVAIAPALARFYSEPRLLTITVVLGAGFLLNSSAAQHRAMLQRGMRFGALAVIDTLSLLSGIVAGIGMALSGMGYWALVMMNVTPALFGATGTWVATRWIPGRPSRNSGIRSMLVFGGTVTLNNLLVYVAYNVDKMLLGRVFGADVLGLYSRAYQLINIPTENLNSTISQVALPALARIKDDPQRLRSYFLQGYGLFFAVLAPLTVCGAVFADEVIYVFLGARWHDAAIVFRCLAPTILVFAIVNPFGWLMLAMGNTGRSLRIAFVLVPVVITGYALGLPWGGQGVALGFSAAMVTLAIPIVMWSTRDTLFTLRDVISQLLPVFTSIAVAATVILTTSGRLRQIQPVFVRLVIETGVFLGVYALFLLVVMKRQTTYSKILVDLRQRPIPVKA